MKGYWNRPDQTAKVIREGWLYTADLGYLNEQGYLHVVDRLQERGLVERQPHPEDRRACFAALTDEGEKLTKRIFTEHVACLEQVLSGLNREQQQEAAELLKMLGRTAAELEVEAAW